MINTLLPPRKVFSRIGLALFLYFIAVYASNFLFNFIAANLFPFVYTSNLFNWVIIFVCQYVIGFPVILLVLSGLPKYKYPKKKIKFSFLFSIFAVCQGVSYIGNIIGVYLNQFVSVMIDKEINNHVDQLIKNSNPIVLILVVGITGPIVEELIFRKCIIDRIAPYGEALAVFFSAITFGMFHGNFYQLFYSFAIGFILAYIYLKSQKIIYPIIIHCVFNSISVVAQIMLNFSTNNSLGVIINGVSLALYYIIILANFVITIIGFVKLAKFIKNIHFIKSITDIEKRKIFSNVVLNVGIILFSICAVVEFAISIFL